MAKTRDKFLENISLINDFIDENPDQFRQRELSYVAGFERFVKGNFIVERDLKNY